MENPVLIIFSVVGATFSLRFVRMTCGPANLLIVLANTCLQLLHQKNAQSRRRGEADYTAGVMGRAQDEVTRVMMRGRERGKRLVIEMHPYLTRGNEKRGRKGYSYVLCTMNLNQYNQYINISLIDIIPSNILSSSFPHLCQV